MSPIACYMEQNLTLKM